MIYFFKSGIFGVSNLNKKGGGPVCHLDLLPPPPLLYLMLLHNNNNSVHVSLLRHVLKNSFIISSFCRSSVLVAGV